MTDAAASRWLHRYAPRARAAVTLLCLPPAGSSAAVYARWTDRLPADIEVAAVEYPGRGARRREASFVRLHRLVAAMLAAIAPTLGRPFAVFGHSLGGLVAFELVRHLARARGPAPLGLYVAGCAAPMLGPSKPPLFSAAEPDFVEALRDLNGTEEAWLRDETVMRLFLPSLRADFEMTDTYVYEPGQPLRCPVTLIGGDSDRHTPLASLAGWKSLSVAPVETRLYPGDHFFLRTAEAAIVHDLGMHLQETLAGAIR
ncbi:MAG: thioesterase II family protein [Vicinamibacterales bacterium]